MQPGWRKPSLRRLAPWAPRRWPGRQQRARFYAEIRQAMYRNNKNLSNTVHSCAPGPDCSCSLSGPHAHCALHSPRTNTSFARLYARASSTHHLPTLPASRMGSTLGSAAFLTWWRSWDSSIRSTCGRQQWWFIACVRVRTGGVLRSGGTRRQGRGASTTGPDLTGTQLAARGGRMASELDGRGRVGPAALLPPPHSPAPPR